MNDFFEILSVFLLSAVKFGLGGVPAAVFAKFSFFKAVVVTCSGGIAGTVFFANLSNWLITRFKKGKENRASIKAKKKKIFTRTNRIIVYTKTKLGLAGISIITPLFLSIPLGVFVAVRYYENKQKIILYMSVSVLLWAVLLYIFYNNFYLMVKSWF